MESVNIEELKTENEMLKKENEELKNRLKKYTNPERNKKYYQTHRVELNSRPRNPHKPPSVEQKKEYNKRAYEKRKQKLSEKNDVM